MRNVNLRVLIATSFVCDEQETLLEIVVLVEAVAFLQVTLEVMLELSCRAKIEFQLFFVTSDERLAIWRLRLTHLIRTFHSEVSATRRDSPLEPASSPDGKRILTCLADAGVTLESSRLLSGARTDACSARQTPCVSRPTALPTALP